MKIDLRSLSFNLTGAYEYVTDPPYLADNGTFAIELQNYSTQVGGGALFGEEGFFEIHFDEFILGAQPI